MLITSILTTALAGVLVTATSSPTIHKRDAAPWAGSNLYFLHALPIAEQERYINTLASWGAKVIRLWVTGLPGGCIKGSPNTTFIPHLEPTTVGTYDTTVLAALDATLALLHSAGLKAIISPHDAGQIAGANGCDAYCAKYGNQTAFYTSAQGIQDYDARLAVVLGYESPNFGGRKWGELSEVVMAFDVQNEPMIDAVGLLEEGDPGDWVCGRAGVMRGLMGEGSGVKVATGGIGGSQYCCEHEFNGLERALGCEAVDVVSVHGYMSKAEDWAYFITGDASILKAVEAVDPGKEVVIEEWGVAADSEDGFNTQVEVFNDAGVPWLYWQVVLGKDQTQGGALENCGYDGFEIGLNSTKGNISAAIVNA
ncbi:putative beta- -mannanase protein [Lasiodiplodia theobromae]|nr:putative beta- -mannanase protein [Lasiodiplodia theobromae]